MEQICYNCFQESLNEQGICTLCGFDGSENRQRYPLALPLGSILYGRYILGRVLGQGGFGITYLAQDFQTKGLVAVKEFFPDTMATRSGRATVMPLSGDQGENFSYGLQCFLEEAQTMAEFIGNPNIARVFCYFEENGTGYFVMEYLDGCSLLDYIKSHNGRLTWDEAMGIALPIMDALTAMHEKGIIHRDVTPDNIYITRDGQVKLLDFGAARHSLGNVSRSLDVILKHGFAPKEQYSRRGRQGPFTDVYSLGATIYYAITGVKPDDAIERSDEDNLPLPTNLGARISVAQEEALLKAMAVRAADRYESMQEFKAAMLQAQPLPKTESIPAPIPEPEPEPITPPVSQQEPEQEEAPIQPPVKKKKRGKGLLIAACVTCLVAGAAFVGVPFVRYNQAVSLMEAGEYSQAIAVFSDMDGYRDSTANLRHCQREQAKILLNAGNYDEAISLYESLGDSEAVVETKNAKAYHEADVLAEKGENGKAAIAFGKLSGYRDARERSFALWDTVAERETISGYNHTVGLRTDGTVVATGMNIHGQCNVSDWTDIVAVSAGAGHTVGLKADGTVVTTDQNVYSWFNLSNWTDIVAVSTSGYHMVGLKSDGTVVATGYNEYGQCNVSNWKDIVTIDADGWHTVGLKSDGTVVATGSNEFGQSVVSDWKDIVMVSAGEGDTVGLRSDGTVVATGWNHAGLRNVTNWTDIVAIVAGYWHTVGIKSDGTMVAVGENADSYRNISSWKDIKLPNKVQP